MVLVGGSDSYGSSSSIVAGWDIGGIGPLQGPYRIRVPDADWIDAASVKQFLSICRDIALQRSKSTHGQGPVVS